MKIGILLPIAETDRGAILRYREVRAAALALGRDPDTLEVTVGQIVTFPGLTLDQEFPQGTDRFMFASPDDLAAEWREYEAHDVKHVIVWPIPYDARCLELVTTALRAYRGGIDQ